MFVSLISAFTLCSFVGASQSLSAQGDTLSLTAIRFKESAVQQFTGNQTSHINLTSEYVACCRHTKIMWLTQLTDGGYRSQSAHLHNPSSSWEILGLLGLLSHLCFCPCKSSRQGRSMIRASLPLQNSEPVTPMNWPMSVVTSLTAWSIKTSQPLET